MRTFLTIIIIIFGVFNNIARCGNHIEKTRNGRLFSLFSIVQFPNEECTALTTTTTVGTCYSGSDCTSRGGTIDGTCAAGFGVCCVITTSTCGSTISTNTSYIQNPGYTSSYTPTATGTCAFTFSKMNDNICQLRLDFQTFSGFATSTTTAGTCTDYMSAAGQSGSNPPNICGTNTGYHMYVEFGSSSTDSVTVTNTYADTTTGKTFNVLARQIACDAIWKAPNDCVQYFTGISGSVYSYNFAGGQMLASMVYNNCIRTEKGYCAIQWKESSTSPPDSFGLGAAIASATAANVLNACPLAWIAIPNLSQDGITPLTASSNTVTTGAWQSQACGTNFGIEQTGSAIASPLVYNPCPSDQYIVTAVLDY